MSSEEPSDRKPIGRFAHLLSSTNAPKSSDDSAYTTKDSEVEPHAVSGRGRMLAALAVRLLIDFNMFYYFFMLTKFNYRKEI